MLIDKKLIEKEREKTQYIEKYDEKVNECTRLVGKMGELREEITKLEEEREEAVTAATNKSQNETIGISRATSTTSGLDSESSTSTTNNATALQLQQLESIVQQQDKSYQELTIAFNNLQHDRSQIYFYLTQKNEESLNYYNEIQRLNEIILNLNKDLTTTKQQHDKLTNDFNLEIKIVEELNEEIGNLRNALFEVKQQNESQNRSEEGHLETMSKQFEEKLRGKEDNLNKLKYEFDQLNDKYESLQFELKRCCGERDQALMSLKEKEMDQRNRQSDDKEQCVKLGKELERLRQHLVEMSESYTKEAIQAENREKELRTLLSQAEENINSQNSTIVNTSKESQKRSQELLHENQDLKEERQRLMSRLKELDESYQSQVKATKNLELVLERIQIDKDNQHNIEIQKYQDTIKQNAVTIHTLQKDINNYKVNEINLKKFILLNESFDSFKFN